MRKIAIRADGGSDIGLGHLIRCFALAEMLKNDFKIEFYCIRIPEDILSDIIASNYQVHLIKQNSAMKSLIDVSTLIILDGYHFSSEYQLELKVAGYKLVCIDDLFDKEFYADLIINHAPMMVKSKYLYQNYTDFAIGVDYALLRPAFLNAALKNRIVNKLDAVLICFGGSDNKNFSLHVLNACILNNNFKQIFVVTGAAYQHMDILNELVERDIRIKHYHALNETEMLSIMNDSDIAIVPSSGILYEVLAAGCLVAAGYYVENQKGIYDGFKQMSAFVDLNDFKDLSLLHSINIDHFKNTKRNVIDGRSSIRLNQKLKELVN